MSRIGKIPIPVPDKVKIVITPTEVAIEGPLGKLKQALMPVVSIQHDEAAKRLVVLRKDDSRQAKAAHGLYRALVRNMVEGVTKGYEKKLEIVGVGYIAAIQKNELQLRVGFANEVHMPIPAGLNVTCPDQTHILVKGPDKQL